MNENVQATNWDDHLRIFKDACCDIALVVACCYVEWMLFVIREL